MAAPYKQNSPNTIAINLIVVADLAKQLAEQSLCGEPDLEVLRDLGDRLRIKSMQLLKQGEKVLYKENL